LIKPRSLKSSKAISELFTGGNSVIANDLFAKFLYVQDTDSKGEASISIAYSVPKKRIPSAVNRNRVKRLLRAACQAVFKEGNIPVQNGRLEMILVYKSEILKDYHSIFKDTQTIFNKIGRKLQAIR